MNFTETLLAACSAMGFSPSLMFSPEGPGATQVFFSIPNNDGKAARRLAAYLRINGMPAFSRLGTVFVKTPNAR